MKEIIVDSWKRKSHYEWFSSFANPCFDMTVRLDVTELLTYCKQNGISFFAAVMFISSNCINSIEPFCYRISEDGRVWNVERANVAYTLAVDDYFINRRAITGVPFDAFLQNLEENKATAATYKQSKFNDTAIIDDIYCSCVPWTDFVSVTQPIPDHMNHNSCIPRVCWGKYSEENGRYKMTMNITVHHALVDGKELAELYNLIQSSMNSPTESLR